MDCKTDKADLGKRNVTVRELTPRELDRWLSPDWKGPEYPGVIDELYAETLLSGDVILLTTDLGPDELLDIPPHKMDVVCQKIKALNPFFVRMLERVGSQLRTAAER